MALELNIKKTTQLNEKVLVQEGESSVEKYNILYPETIAPQVIEDALHRFVTDEQIELWTNGGTYGLCYRGQWNVNGWEKTDESGTVRVPYKKNDVVYYAPADSKDGVRYFICISNNPTVAPSMTQDNANWRNIDLSAYIATNAKNVKTKSSSSNATQYVTFVDSNNVNPAENGGFESVYTSTGLKFTPGTGVLEVTKVKADLEGNVTGDVTGNVTGNVTGDVTGNLHGVADEAEKYTVYATWQNTDPEAPHYTTDPSLVGKVDTDNREKVSNSYIDDTIRDITSGASSVILGNPLTLQKDGVTESIYNNSEAITFNVKQNYGPNDIINLLNEQNKIKEEWLPDSVLGQLEYQGTWDASQQATGVTVKRGYFWICRTAGNYAPDGTLMTPTVSTETNFFQKSDWAVFNGETWDKIDNTDMVTSVNGRIGDVSIYQGDWKTATQYYLGDIVSYNSCLYIAIEDNRGDQFDASKWLIFGRVYGASDGIKLDTSDWKFKHDVTITPGDSESKTLNAGQPFVVPGLTRDAYGHVTKIDLVTYTLGSDFVNNWRPIGHYGADGAFHNDLLTDDKKNLNIGGDTWINWTYANDILTASHKQIASVPTLTTNKITDSQEGDDILYAGQGYTIPSITVDAAGHITVGELKRFRLADTGFTHSHFDITTTNNVKNIEAYSATKATEDWVKGTDSALKFYLGSVNPTNTSRMNFNGGFHATELYQGNDQVLDSAMKLFNGVGSNGSALYGTFDKTNKILNAPDSGVGAGWREGVNHAVYSAVQVNKKGIVTAGGQIVEFGQEVDADPSAALAVGGLFFRMMGVVE